MTAKGNKALASLYCWTVAAYTLAWLQRAKGLHGHYRCTTSRWPSVTWDSTPGCSRATPQAQRAAVIFRLRAGDCAEEQPVWVTALSQRPVQHSSGICLRGLGWANTEPSHRAATLPIAQPHWLQTLMGLHAVFIGSILGNLIFF